MIGAIHQILRAHRKAQNSLKKLTIRGGSLRGPRSGVNVTVAGGFGSVGGRGLGRRGLGGLDALRGRRHVLLEAVEVQ